MPLPAAPPTAPRAPVGDSGGRRVGWRPLLAVLATLVTVAPALLVVARFAARDVLLTGDLAIIDARVRDLVHGEFPLVGPYSSGWSHPGPLFFVLLAPLPLLTGASPWALVVGGALLHVLAVALSARLAWRRGGLALTLGILAVYSLSLLGATDRILLDPWNPHVAMPFFVLFVLQVWSVTVGDRWQLLGAAIVGAFLMQTHLGYLPVVGIGLLAALLVLLLDSHRAHASTRTWAVPVLTAAGASIALWSTALYEQVTGDPGNLTRIARYFDSTPEGQMGLQEGVGTFAALFRPVPVWLGGPERLVPLTFQPRPESSWWLLVPVVLLTSAAILARRHRLRAEARLVGVVALLAVIGTFALARLKSQAWSYMSLWRIPLALLVVLAAVWTVWRAWNHPPALARGLAIGACCVAILGGVVPVSRDVLATDHVASGHDCAAPIVRQIGERIPTGRILVRRSGPALWGVMQTVVDDLDRRGADVVVDLVGADAWGTSRAASLSDVDEVWVVTEDGLQGVLLEAAPGALVIARTGSLPMDAERELAALQLRLARHLDERGRSDLVPWLDRRDLVELLPEQVPTVDRVETDRIAALLDQLVASAPCRVVVVAFAPDDLPSPLADG